MEFTIQEFFEKVKKDNAEKEEKGITLTFFPLMICHKVLHMISVAKFYTRSESFIRHVLEQPYTEIIYGPLLNLKVKGY